MRSHDSTDINILLAAYLATEKRTQKEIGEQLGMTQGAISRLLQRAKDLRLIVEEVRFREPLSEERRQTIDLHLARRPIVQQLKAYCLRHRLATPMVRVFSGGPSTQRSERMVYFAGQASLYVRSLVNRSRVCGLSWGRMLANVVEAINSLPPIATRPEGQRVDVVPLAGDPYGQDPARFSSSYLSAQLYHTVNGSWREPHIYLGMVPAFVPNKGIDPEEIWKLIGFVEWYTKIFGKRDRRTGEWRGPALADQLDMILTSVGTSEYPLGYGGNPMFEHVREMTHDKLKALIVGDLAGVCLPKPGKEAIVAQFNQQWSGVRESQLKACAARAFAAVDNPNGPPGTVVLAVGKDRAPILIELIRQQWINHLLIESDAEEALLQAMA